MEQITREEMIELVETLDVALILLGEDEYSEHRVKARKAIAALQASEPEMVVDIRRDPRDGSPSPRILKFADLGDGEHQLFTLPCPPAKAQVPDAVIENLARQYGCHTSEGFKGFALAVIEKHREALLAASPAPNNDKDGCTCQGCGIVYAADLIVPDEWWEKIKPEGKAEGSGLLCPTCIMDRLVEKGWSAGHIASPAPDRSEQSPELYLALRNLRQSVEFLEQCKRENPDAATGAWKDAWDWVESTAVSVVNIVRQQEDAD